LKKRKKIEDPIEVPTQPETSQFTSLIELMYENGVAERAIRDNVSLFFLAGHETTVTTLSWICSILASQPEIQEKARAEVFQKASDPLTYDSLKDLHYIDGLIKESLRVYPPVVALADRNVEKEISFNNIHIPAETFIIMDLISMGFDAKLWGDPEVIRPERWYSDNITKEQRSAWLPFSTGPRVCIGINFSLLEQKIWLVEVLKRFKQIRLAPGAVIIQNKASITYAPNFDKLRLEFVK